MLLMSFKAWLNYPDYYFYWTYDGINNSVFDDMNYKNPAMDNADRGGAVRDRSGQIQRRGQELHHDRLRRCAAHPARQRLPRRSDAEVDRGLHLLVPPRARLSPDQASDHKRAFLQIARGGSAAGGPLDFASAEATCCRSKNTCRSERLRWRTASRRALCRLSRSPKRRLQSCSASIPRFTRSARRARTRDGKRARARSADRTRRKRRPRSPACRSRSRIWYPDERRANHVRIEALYRFRSRPGRRRGRTAESR